MKKLIIYSLLALLSVAFSATESKASNGWTKAVLPGDSATAKLMSRIDEIHNMDKSALTRDEKKILRKEIRQTEKAIYEETGGVYIYFSVGLLLVLLIILLIILL